MLNRRVVMMMALSIVLGLGTVLGASRWMSARAAAANAKVVVAARDLPLGTRLSAEHLTLAEWPQSASLAGVFRDPKLLDTRVINTSIARGVPLVEAKLAPPGSKGGLSAVIAAGKRAMTVKVNEVVGVAGFALPGNLVDVVLNTKDAGSTPVSKIVLEQIMVLAIAQEAGRDDTKPKVVSAVTLEVTPAQAEKLDLGRNIGTLSLVLRNQVDQVAVATPGTRKTDLLGEGASSGEPSIPRTRTAGGSKPALGADAAGSAARTPGKHKTVEVIRGSIRTQMEVTVFE
jgi:pilus assembly protein CpaB